MSRPIRLAASARRELGEAARWHEKQRPGLGRELKEAVSSVLRIIAEQPEVGSRLRSRLQRSLLRYLVPRFPYQVIYYATERDLVVLAVAHTRRRPSYWRERLTPTEG